MGHADEEISAAFSQFDSDKNQILDKDEQERMIQELEEKRVCRSLYGSQLSLFLCMYNLKHHLIWTELLQLSFSSSAHQLGGTLDRAAQTQGYL